MPEKIQMLALSPTMETGTISNWIKQEGETIANGDVLCEVETDKATMEYEAIQEGTLLKIIVQEGGSVAVGKTIGIIGETGDDIDALVEEARKETETGDKEAGQPGAAAGTTAEAAPAASKEEPESPLTELEAEDTGERVKSSPLARKMAERANIRLSSIKGTGPGGRIVKRDVETAAAKGTTSKPAAVPRGEDKIIPVSGKRKVIAQRLSESKYSAPHYYLKMSVFTESMMKSRSSLNAELSRKISVNAFLMKFAAEAIKRHPIVNSSWEGDTIRQFASIDIGLAVAQDDGLITPVVRDCGAKGIVEIDSELESLVEKARGNKLTPEEYTGATFSISSLGSYGVDEFTAIINPPGSAILTIGRMKKVPVVSENDEIEIKAETILSLSCDHRVIDGAKGAEFLRELKFIMENPIRVLY